MNLHDFLSGHRSEIISALIGAVATIVVMVFIIGWDKIAWAIKELAKMYSANEKSYWGKKRIESGIAFIIAEHGAIFWLAKKYADMSTTDFVMWAGIQLTIAGWMVNQIQKEKIINGENGNNNTENKQA